jgi:hypothetical protein
MWNVGCEVHNIGTHKEIFFHFCLGSEFFNKGIMKEEKKRKGKGEEKRTGKEKDR